MNMKKNGTGTNRAGVVVTLAGVLLLASEAGVGAGVNESDGTPWETLELSLLETDEALQVDLHGAFAKSLVERCGRVDDELLVQLADAVAVKDRQAEALGRRPVV